MNTINRFQDKSWVGLRPVKLPTVIQAKDRFLTPGGYMEVGPGVIGKEIQPGDALVMGAKEVMRPTTDPCAQMGSFMVTQLNSYGGVEAVVETLHCTQLQAEDRTLSHCERLIKPCALSRIIALVTPEVNPKLHRPNPVDPFN